MDSRIGIFWLREDFRLTRNDALAYASQNHEKVITIYFYKKNFLKIDEHKSGGYLNL